MPVMAGSYTKDAELLSQWCFLLTTPHIQTNEKESNMCLLSGGYGDQGCFLDAKSPRSVQLIQLIAVYGGFFCSNPISWSRNPVFRKSLKLLGTCASFCLNSTSIRKIKKFLRMTYSLLNGLNIA